VACNHAENNVMAVDKVLIKVRLILYFKGQILLLRQTKPNGGNYTLVGGTVESNETAPQALIREAYEEAGVVLKEKDLQLVHVLEKVKHGERRLTLYFKTYRWEGRLMAREVHKFNECEWFHLDELPKNLTESVRHVMQNYRNGVMFSVIK